MKILKELLGRDPDSKKMKALFEIERCRRSLSSVLSAGIIDKTFDDQRKNLEEMLNTLCEQLRDKINYSNWWEDWEKAIEKQHSSRG